MFEKVLVANRGEIACRVLRTCARLGIRTVAIYSDADADALHVRQANESVHVGKSPVRESYLNIPAIVEAARQTGAAAVHPGYGLLSESPVLARAVKEAGLSFIGPAPEALAALGDKLMARSLAEWAGLLPVPGLTLATQGARPSSQPSVQEAAASVGYPVLVKAVAGGGGIGMQVVRDPAALERAWKTCADRARAAFGDDRVYLERYIERPRHIEVQVLSDGHGGCITLGERECSVQRRHQKIVEESPSPASFLQGEEGEKRRWQLEEGARRLIQQVGYSGVATCEFIADHDGNFYFLEVNARLQVEHPVTEMRTGIDLVEQQLRVACGERLSPELTTIARHGHAVEARLYAEDPGRGFLPQPGRVSHLVWPPAAEDLRIETGIEAGTEITPFYDPLLAKIIAYAATRGEAIARLDAALQLTSLEVQGAKGPARTNLEFLREVLASEGFRSGVYDTGLAESLAESARRG